MSSTSRWIPDLISNPRSFDVYEASVQPGTSLPNLDWLFNDFNKNISDWKGHTEGHGETLHLLYALIKSLQQHKSREPIIFYTTGDDNYPLRLSPGKCRLQIWRADPFFQMRILIIDMYNRLDDIRLWFSGAHRLYLSKIDNFNANIELNRGKWRLNIEKVFTNIGRIELEERLYEDSFFQEFDTIYHSSIPGLQLTNQGEVLYTWGKNPVGKTVECATAADAMRAWMDHVNLTSTKR